MNRWKTIWNKRTLDRKEQPQLADLLRLDGYDSGAGTITTAVWQSYVVRRATELELTAGNTVFEIGCGAGAFLWVLRGLGCQVAGLDYAKPLIATAARAMPDSHWQVGEANQPLGTAAYDVVVAQSVFHYFPSEEYARQVLHNMTQGARRAVAILDVPDTHLAEQAEVYRQAALGQKEYQQRYADLHHLTLTPVWFETNAPPHWEVTIAPQDIAEFGNTPFRFNVILRREN